MQGPTKAILCLALAALWLQGCAVSRDVAPARAEPARDLGKAREATPSDPMPTTQDSEQPTEGETDDLKQDAPQEPAQPDSSPTQPPREPTKEEPASDPKKPATDAKQPTSDPKQPTSDPKQLVDEGKGPAALDRPALDQAPKEPAKTAPAMPTQEPVGAAEVTSAEPPLQLEGDTFVEEEEKGAPQGAGSPHGQVQALERAISGYREDFGVEAPSERGGLSCEEVDELKDGICGSSQKICKIAQAYPQEAWFAERCQWAQRQCEDAQGRSERCGR